LKKSAKKSKKKFRKKIEKKNPPGTYADDCLCTRVTEHRCYIVATNDRDLKRRLRKIPGVPIIFCKRGQFGIERLPGHIASVPGTARGHMEAMGK
jgi:rRNA-processing protein FCF1